MRICSVCGIEKPESEFNNRKDCKSGLRKECRECQSLKSKEYYQKNAERLKAKQREWNANNKDKKKLYSKLWYLENPEKVNESRKKWANDNPDKVKKIQKHWVENNREKVAEKSKRWRLNNLEHAREIIRNSNKKRNLIPSNRISTTISSGIRRCLRGAKSKKHWESIVGYSIEDLKKHLESLFTENMSWENHGKIWEIDHVVPLALFQFDSCEDEAFKKAWSLNNLQPLLKNENRRKGAKHPNQWLDIVKQQKILYNF